MQCLTMVCSAATIAGSCSMTSAGITAGDDTGMHTLLGFDVNAVEYRMMPAEFLGDLEQLSHEAGNSEITFNDLAIKLTDGFDHDQIELHAEVTTPMTQLGQQGMPFTLAEAAPAERDSDQTDDQSSVLSTAYVLSSAIRMMSSAVPAPGGMALAFGGMLIIARRKR
jgi:hypothetical protein